MRSSANSCPREFFAQYIAHRVPFGDNTHLVAGISYAKGLEVFRREWERLPSSLSHDDRRAEALIPAFEAFTKAWGTHETPQDMIFPIGLRAKSFDRVWGAVLHHLVVYPPWNEHVKTYIFNNEPIVEFSFAFDVPEVLHPQTGDPLIYAGRFDRLASWRDLLWVYDDKSTGSMNMDWAEKYHLSSQLIGYVRGAKLFGHKVAGALVRGICIQMTQYKMQETYPTFEQWQIDEWYERLVWNLRDAVEFWKAGFWPQTGMENGNCFKCDYRKMCGTLDPVSYLNSNMKEYSWSPLTRQS